VWRPITRRAAPGELRQHAAATALHLIRSLLATIARGILAVNSLGVCAGIAEIQGGPKKRPHTFTAAKMEILNRY